MRRWLSRARQGRVIALLALALFVRALVPTGWMPVATAQGVTFALCAGQGTPLKATAMHHGQAEHGEAGHDKAALPDHPCAFAGLGLAADTAPPLPLAALAPAAASPPLPRALAVAVGRGLAAPPPPSTGPPSFA